MLRRPAALVIVGILTLASCRSEPGARTAGDASAIVAADSLITAGMAQRHVPGVALVVLRRDDTVMSRGYGRLSADSAAPVQPTTVFQLGSISKQFLAALVLAMAEDGRLGLEDPVRRHLPGFAQLPPTIRIRHLLNHTSGIRELFMLPEAQAGFDNLASSRADLVAAIRRAPVDFVPGARWSYSNTNYTMLALIVERLAGKPYEDVLTERFFRPHGLRSLRQCTSLPRDALEARGHELRAGAAVRAAPENMEWIRGDGGLCGNALDVARWTRLLATGRIVSAASYQAMTTATSPQGGQTAEYGFALSFVPLDGVPKVAHNGAMRGYSASAAYYPDSALTVVILTNRGDVRTEAIERAVARVFLGLPAPRYQEAHTVPADVRAHLAGTYDVGVFDARITDRADGLWLETPPPGPTARLVSAGGGRYVAESEPDGTWVIFDTTASPPAALRLFMGAMHWHGTRKRTP